MIMLLTVPFPWSCGRYFSRREKVKRGILPEKRLCFWPKIILFSLWFGLYFYLCLCHEPFRDEAQSFMIAKHNSIPGIMNFCWEEGHPWLWHLFLYPFAHLGFPYVGVKWLGFALTALGVGLYVQKSPFPFPVTALTVFLEYSYYCSFGRCYSLMLLLCMLTATSWKNRLCRPWVTSLCLGLLASVHMMAWPLCAILGCIHIAELVRPQNVPSGGRRNGLLEKRPRLRLLAPPCGLAPAALFCVPLWPQIERTFAKFGWNPVLIFILLGLSAVSAVVLIALLPWAFRGKEPYYIELGSWFYAFLPLIAAVSTYLLLNKATSSTIAAETNLLHLCEIVPLVLSAAWVAVQSRRELAASGKTEKTADGEETSDAAAAQNRGTYIRSTAFVSALVLLWCFYVNTRDPKLHEKIRMDTKSYYSGSGPLAEYIRENVPKDAVIIATRKGTNTSVAAYLDGEYTLTCLLSHEPLYYTKWCTDWNYPIPRSQWLPDLKALLEEHGELYVIYSDDTEVSNFADWLWGLVDRGGAQMVYHSNAAGESLKDVPDKYKPIERCETMGLYKITAID